MYAVLVVAVFLGLAFCGVAEATAAKAARRSGSDTAFGVSFAYYIKIRDKAEDFGKNF